MKNSFILEKGKGMIGVYFSGTGNTKHCIQKFLMEIDSDAHCISIEDKNVVAEIRKNDFIVLAYPVYFSNTPKIMRDFIIKNGCFFAGKNVFLIATMGLFSGDGTGCAARLLKKYSVHIVGGLHLKMPDCIGDEKVLKKTMEQNKQIVKEAELKISDSARKLKDNASTQEGIGWMYHMAGLFGQRLWFYNKTKDFSDKLKIDTQKCVGCGACVKLCPLANLKILDKKAIASGKCTMCYRCVNNCPRKAITLLGKTIYEQCKIENYR